MNMDDMRRCTSVLLQEMTGDSVCQKTTKWANVFHVAVARGNIEFLEELTNLVLWVQVIMMLRMMPTVNNPGHHAHPAPGRELHPRRAFMLSRRFDAFKPTRKLLLNTFIPWSWR